jgi:hypothetical protein
MTDNPGKGVAGEVEEADETGWLIELKGQTPQWAVILAADYDEHWTTDASKALRFAREQDAQAYIDHIGWTDAFPTEHMWTAPRLPASPEPLVGRGPETEAELRRDGFFLCLNWWRFGTQFTARVYEPFGIRVSDALADMLALALEERPRRQDDPAAPPEQEAPAAVEQPVGVVVKALPSNVYYSREHGNFYAIDTHKGQGIPFWRAWKDRALEFPDDPRSSLSSVSIPLEVLEEQLAYAEKERDELREEVERWKERAADRNAECDRRARKQWDAEARASVLEALAEHINWELDWGERDPNGEGSECGWRVHERSGNVNDLEWKLLGFGATPEEALRRARDTAKGGA